jgi:lysophospholipase L1-like esterase
VAAGADRRVHLREFCVSGAKSVELAQQVDAALPTEPDVVVILIGANDVTNQTLPSESVRYLSEAVRRLHEADIAVVVGTCPDLGTVRPIPQPLRQVARTWSRRLAAAQAIAVVEAGGRAVSLGSILGPEFDASPALLFGPDRFHPSAAGYSALVGVLVPSTLAALGFAPPDEAAPEARRGEGVLSIGRAAVQAAKHPGTELGGTEVDGSARGIGGRWVTLMRRRRPVPVDAEAPDPDEPPTDVGASESGAEVS